ncbi:MAG: Thioredoxin [Chlamydiae bacterium]|nr:Thioredoxin [Chlamydiota bacterium]
MLNKKIVTLSFLAVSLLFGSFHSQVIAGENPAIKQVVLDGKGKTQSAYVEKMNDTNFEAVIANGVVIVDFYADWCGPCKRFAPTFEKVAEEMYGTVAFGKLNVDEGVDASRSYKVSSIPTLILFKDGQEVKRRVGGCSAKELIVFIQAAL